MVERQINSRICDNERSDMGWRGLGIKYKVHKEGKNTFSEDEEFTKNTQEGNKLKTVLEGLQE